MSDSPGLDYRFGSDDEDDYDYGEDFTPESPDGFEDDFCGTADVTAPTDDYSDSENLQSVSMSTDKAGTDGIGQSFHQCGGYGRYRDKCLFHSAW